MANSIVQVSETQVSSASPFDEIRRYDNQGKEWWSARDLQKMLGYVKWQMFEGAIDLGLENLELAVGDTSSHALLVEVTLKHQKVKDYKLSRIACYHIALACDSRGKPNVKSAKHYFAVKTREAEVVIPAQNEHIRLLELQNENLKLENENLKLRAREADRQDARIAFHGVQTTLILEGKSDAVVEIDRPTIEIIDERNNTSYKGQTLTQIKDFLLKKHGVKMKSGADIKRLLESKKLDGYIAQTPRSVLQEYVPEEFCQDVVSAVLGTSRQILLGE